MATISLTLTSKGERRLLYSALGRFNSNGYITYINPEDTIFINWGRFDLRLFTNNHTVSKSTQLSDLTECTLGGYESQKMYKMDYTSRTADTDTTNTVYSKVYRFDFTETGNIYGAYVQEPDFSEGVLQEETITCPADNNGSIGGNAVWFIGPNGIRESIWYNTGSDSSPEVAAINHEVSISINATAAEVATATANKMNSIGMEVVSVDGADITYSHIGNVAAEAGHDFSFQINTEGSYQQYGGSHELTKYTCTGGSGLGGKYITYNVASTLNEVFPFYTWYNTGSDVDPEQGVAGIEVEIDGTETAAEIAAITAQTMQMYQAEGYDAYGIQPITHSGDDIYIENVLPCAVDASTAGDSGFTMTRLVTSTNNGIVWWAGNFGDMPLEVNDGDSIELELALSIN